MLIADTNEKNETTEIGYWAPLLDLEKFKKAMEKAEGKVFIIVDPRYKRGDQYRYVLVSLYCC